ncbi:MAG: NTP transferase domain-containing protein [Bacteroidia bacterium]|nr:NTP transferase domain-containing protein [Bacteroidia bacterium]
MKRKELYGLVLAGGKSSRMGKDKGLIDYHGKPQREHLFDLLSKFCDHVFTSCRAEQHIPASLNPICDKFDLDSPLNGILSSFELHTDKTWLVVAVDMPFVNEEVFQFLILNRDPTKVATCFFDSDGKLPEPLLTIWEPNAFPSLSKFMVDGGSSPREFLIQNVCNKLVYADSKIYINYNTLQELEKGKH